jgi:NitT/TauT family transport system permease protein
MTAAYALSMIFTLVYGRWAAYHRTAELVLMPLLDVLQSVPILSFLPVVLLGLSAILPETVAAELASIVLIFTSQAWNLTFAWYQSLTTIPKELREASSIYRFGSWMRFKTLELPFAAISLIWNSMMSWAGGWFFLMAAEFFTVGQRDFRLPGLGSYLHQAANQGNLPAIAYGILTLIVVIVALDQLVWRPLLAWSERFKLEMVSGSGDREASSWFYGFLRGSQLLSRVQERVTQPFSERFDHYLNHRFPGTSAYPSQPTTRPWVYLAAGGAGGLVLLYGTDLVVGLLAGVSLGEWVQIGIGVLATLLRVILSLGIALAWTIPVGVAIGTNPRLSAVLQPLVQITASVPATALFPAFLLVVANLPGGIDIAAVVLMLLGTQWYLLFNIIAGAAAIPQDLKYTTTMLQLSRWERWRTLILPALFPYIVTGGITASGGAWNASIVAEQVQFAGRTLSTTGIGALIAQATGSGNYALLLAATMTLVLSVILINRLIWRRLYRLAEEQYRME